jgi:isoleucyl-tRNA synthetase
MYLINSPVVRAESLRFVKQGVSDTVRKVLLPWYNSCSFFEQCITRLRKDGKDFEASAYTNFKTDNKFDCWIRSSYNSLVKFVRKELGEGYRLYTVVPKLVTFVDDFTNWYIRLSRDRMKGFNVSDEERLCALATVYEVRTSLYLFFSLCL